MASPEGMKTPEEIERAFETDRAFTDEPVAQSLGRFAWLSVRSRAEFALALFEIGVEEANIPAILEAVDEVYSDFWDFVHMGLKSDDSIESAEHPLEETFTELVDDLAEAIDDSNDVSFLESISRDSMYKMFDLGMLDAEDLIHRLNGHIDRLRNSRNQ